MGTAYDNASVDLCFCDAVEALLMQVKCRHIVDEEELQSVFKLRYNCYLREGAINPDPSGLFQDRFDDLSNTWILGFFIGDQLVSSLRISVATSICRDIPAMMAFSDIIDPLLDEGQKIVDPTRFVIDHDSAKAYPKLPYVTSRASWLASEHFQADCTVSTVRSEHQAFYRRFHGQKVVCEARTYPSLIKPLSLMVGRLEENQHVLQRYPFLRSGRAERVALFDDPPVMAIPPSSHRQAAAMKGTCVTIHM